MAQIKTELAIPKAYTLRIQYAPETVCHLPVKDEDIMPKWSRVFTVSGKHRTPGRSHYLIFYFSGQQI